MVDFSKAFDTISRKGLLCKLKSFGTEGKMFNIIKDLYSNTNVHVTVDNLMSENFEMKLGVKQGDPPSPFFLIRVWMSFTAPSLNGIKFPCFCWADDLVLISTTKEGLQKQIDFVDKYCNDRKLTIDAEKKYSNL